MPIEFQVSLEDKPGSLAWLGSVLGEADVNFEEGAGLEARLGPEVPGGVQGDPCVQRVPGSIYRSQSIWRRNSTS